nr:redoxin domain-containing protein [Cytophagales bacterium]
MRPNTLQLCLLPLILVALFSCSGNGNSDAEHGSDSFTANPIVVSEKPIATLKPGDAAPKFDLPGVDGKNYTLEDFNAEVLVINFTCNHCPTAQAYEDRFNDLVKNYREKGVDFVAISPNSPIAVLPEELGYSDLNDDFESMIQRAKDKAYQYPYLYDGDEHLFSTHYGPTATPHVFVFDKDRKLTYQGRIDASEKPGTGRAEDLIYAIEQTLKGEPLAADRAITPAFGCSVKWAWKNEWTIKVNEDWKKKPVTLAMIDLPALEELLANDSDRLRLVNFWATWCGPCIIEYPEFIQLQRMYGERDFEFVSVSLDSPDAEEKVLKFLKNKYSATKNYLVNNEDKYASIEVVGNDWDGSLPLTLLIEPGGKVHERIPGTINPLALRKTIVDHPMIGRYY